MPAHLKSFMRNSDVYKKNKIIIMPFLAFEKRVVTGIIRLHGCRSNKIFSEYI
jgi:hypothetical protein